MTSIEDIKLNCKPHYEPQKISSLSLAIGVDDEDIQDAWNEFYKTKKNRQDTYAECALDEEELDCDSSELFYDLFLKNDAPYSIGNFMETSIGDSNIKTSLWQKITQLGSKEETTRTMEYSHPINAPLAPPSARSRKEQTLIKFSTYGIILETETYVDDVPMVDCFYVKDRIVVAFDQNKKTKVSAYFDIRFVKNTLLRAFIYHTTKSEFIKSFNLFLKHLQTRIASSLEKSTTITTKSPSAGKKEDERIVKVLPSPISSTKIIETREKSK
eukprot:CAMPEP_0194189362 /NCGR_PEP_ID=MMETSP0154-20130528/58619_1 /TAXON_ID=1049557 /ORGANISM="Thalassiothrix antarctica, Strain L6-D1" /LENGTH=270 /DNA_ID=CAMNT_0038910473 /DNA_START=1 /DNA_END=810 /DNA_ORIENTATION=-